MGHTRDKWEDISIEQDNLKYVYTESQKIRQNLSGNSIWCDEFFKTAKTSIYRLRKLNKVQVGEKKEIALWDISH